VEKAAFYTLIYLWHGNSNHDVDPPSGHGVSLNHGLMVMNPLGSTFVASSDDTSLCTITSCPLPQFAGHTTLW